MKNILFLCCLMMTAFFTSCLEEDAGLGEMESVRELINYEAVANFPPVPRTGAGPGPTIVVPPVTWITCMKTPIKERPLLSVIWTLSRYSKIGRMVPYLISTAMVPNLISTVPTAMAK